MIFKNALKVPKIGLRGGRGEIRKNPMLKI